MSEDRKNEGDILAAGKQEDGTEESYPVISESIKKKKKQPRSAMPAGVAAALFGGLVFVLLFGTGLAGRNRQQENGVSPAAVRDNASVADSVSVIGPDTQTSAAEEDGEDPVLIPGNGDGEERLYEAAEAVEKSMVYVTGSVEEEDIFRNLRTTQYGASGLILRKEGSRFLILVRRSVVSGMDAVYVTFANENIVPGELVAEDAISGLAVVETDGKKLPAGAADSFVPAVIGSAEGLDHGDSIVAIGSPMGYSDAVEVGEITSVAGARILPDREYSLIITNILGSRTGSGVLADADGRVVGWIDPDFAQEEDTPVAVAVPPMELMGLAELLMDGRTPGYAGIVGVTVTGEQRAATGVPEGVYVTGIETDSPAYDAGVMEGDIIIAADGEPVRFMYELADRILNSSTGDKMELRIKRGSAERRAEKEITLTIGDHK